MRLCAGIFLALVTSFLFATAVSAHTPETSPPASIIIVVRQGQTLWSIAKAHGVSVEAIVRANRLRNADAIPAGQRLIIPRSAAGSARPQPSIRRIPSGFLWPARGGLTSRFGWWGRRHHDGIDIAAARGSPVVAAKAGRVSFSGWYGGYGRTVILDHGRGVKTIYGHASRLLVRRGQVVRRGQLIARVGCTGHCSGPHLHFEVRVHDRAVNPLAALPRGGRPVASPVKPPPPPAGRAVTPPLAQAAQTIASPEVVRVERVVVSDGTIITIRTTYDLQGRVARREQEIIMRESCTVVRVRLTYRAVRGTLVLVDQERARTECTEDDEEDDEDEED